MAHRILVVDDDTTTREAVVKDVSDLGHSVVGEAGNGYEALEILKTRSPTLVLLDIVMPGMDGFATLASIKSLRKETRVVMMTSRAGDIDSVRQTLKMGASDFLIKPVTRERLAACINKIPEPWETLARELGKLCCVGYKPTFEERRIMATGRMGYLLYPSCHLAVQFFRDKLCPENNMVILVIQRGLAMYGAPQEGQDTFARFQLEKVEPWEQVVVEAQRSYQRFWAPALKTRLLPRVIPIMTVTPKEPTPVFMDPNEITAMVDEPLVEIDEAAADDPEPEPLGGAGKAVEWSRVAAKICISLNKVEARHPQLVSPAAARTKQATETPEATKKIDTRKVKIVPDHLRGEEQTRMTFGDE